jgi:S-adenosylmethionine:tRNA ribosyltransferase-isomerase
MAGHGRKGGLEIEFKNKLNAKVLKDNGDSTWNVCFNKTGKDFMNIVNKIGLTPLPPYIKRESRIVNRVSPNQKAGLVIDDRVNYQTVYADDRKIGSVAAPTAGLHFTPLLLKKLKDKGVAIVYLTLHVGFGTFAPVKVENIKKHKMHAEFISVKGEVVLKIIKAKAEGRRVVAVGTTSTRTIESIFEKLKIKEFKNCLKIKNYKIKNFAGWTDIFIYPGYKFKIVDGLITNFHLPKSTLLMLVDAFAGKKNIDRAYQYAIKKKYRFYSYGDAMLII